MHTHRKGVTAAPKVFSMKYGEKLLSAFLEQPNETLRDIARDVHAIVAVLDALERAHRVFLELLIDAQGPYEFICEETSRDDYDDIF